MKINRIAILIVLIVGITINTNAQNLPSYLPQNGLVAYWPFNGNANDEKWKWT
jgi:hypothetical protein